MEATGIEYRTSGGETIVALAGKEVILSAGAVGSPHLLLLSGVGPRRELETIGVPCLVDAPHVGKHLKDHIEGCRPPPFMKRVSGIQPGSATTTVTTRKSPLFPAGTITICGILA
jgi:GMC oxidoreductase